MRELETSIFNAFAKRLKEWSGLLASSGWTFQGPEIDVDVTDPGMYTSEMRITFMKFGNIEDVLEFHIYRDGRALVTVDEATSWLGDQLAGIEQQD